MSSLRATRAGCEADALLLCDGKRRTLLLLMDAVAASVLVRVSWSAATDDDVGGGWGDTVSLR